MAKRPRQKKSPTRDQAQPASLIILRSLDPLAATWRYWLPRLALIAAVTLWIYWPSLQGTWLWDDGWYILTNPLMQSWNGLWKFWFAPGSWVEYYPIGETVQWIQWRLWGNDTLGYHLTNVVLHILNAVLLWRLLARFGLKLAWVGGLLFAAHPVQVESVAWISELKNTLSMPFFLLAIGCWIDYEEHRRKQDYRWALGLFLVGMLCKITMAPFPAVILLYAWWKRGRVTLDDLKASVPFWVVSLVLSFTLLWSGSHYRLVGHAQIENIDIGGPLTRTIGAGLISAVYFSRSLLPVDYLLAYPQWQVMAHVTEGLVAWLAFAVVIGACWMKRQTWGRHVLLGFGFYWLMLAPFAGFKSVSYMTFTWVMDHFLYLPLIGLIGLGIAALSDLDSRLPSWGRLGLIAMMTTYIGLMAVESRAFAALFINEETIWGYTLQRNPDSWLAHHDLGCNLLDKGDIPAAAAHLKEVVRLFPSFDGGHYNLAIALDKLGETAAAEAEYRQALALNPNNIQAYLNLGGILKRKGDLAGAEAQLRQAVQMAPDDAGTCTDLAGILVQTGRAPEAIGYYQQAVQLNPDVAELRYNLGNTLLSMGSLEGAIEQLSAAVQLAPQIAQAHENLGVALARAGRVAQAVEQFEDVLQIDPSHLPARSNLALGLAQTGHIPEAIEQYQEILKLKPDDAQARQNMVKLQALQMQQNAAPKP